MNGVTRRHEETKKTRTEEMTKAGKEVQVERRGKEGGKEKVTRDNERKQKHKWEKEFVTNADTKRDSRELTGILCFRPLLTSLTHTLTHTFLPASYYTSLSYYPGFKAQQNACSQT